MEVVEQLKEKGSVAVGLSLIQRVDRDLAGEFWFGSRYRCADYASAD